jgi:hypothetical protein
MAKPMNRAKSVAMTKPAAVDKPQPKPGVIAKPKFKPAPRAKPKALDLLRAIRVAKPQAAKAVPVPAQAPRPEPMQSEPWGDEKIEIPLRYDDDRMVMLARDPWWLFVYWDLSPARLAQGMAWAQGRPYEPMLRVYDITDLAFDGGNAHAWQDRPVQFEQMGHYLNIWAPGRQYVAELGLRDQQGRFFPLLRSNLASAPPDQPSSDLGEEWTDILGAAALWAASWGQDPRAASSLDLTAAGSPSSPWGGASEHLASAWLSGLASSSGASSPASSWGSPSSPWGAAAGQGEQGAAAGSGAGSRRRQFSLWSKTELILYGGTEPDAALTVCGKPVALRPDGTFTLRFALPDGDLDLEVRATSADKIETLGMTHQVQKRTRR